MEQEELTGRIIGAAYEVFNTLGSGFWESVYERALALCLSDIGLDVKIQHAVPVVFRDHLVGDFRCDLLVNDSVIVELKAIEHIAKAHEVQLVNYLTATRIPIGLLINFSPDGVQVKRKHLTKRSPLHSSTPSDPVNPSDPVILSNSNNPRLESAI
jgi:GxxExxY protein